jgi:predicted Zn-dependent protease
MTRYLNPLQWFKWFGQWFVAWFRTIPWKRASTAIPALALTIALAILLFVSTGENVSWRNQLIRDQLASALERDDYKTADLLIRRQIEEGDESAETLFRLAVARHQQDQTEEAYALMRGLVAQQRDPRAARWLLQELYDQKKWADLEDAEQREFGQLLRFLSEETPDDLGIKQAYADYLVRTNRQNQAIPYLVQLASVQPMRGLQAAMISRQAGEDDAATRYAETTLEKVQQLFAEEPANPQLAMANVQALLFLEKYADAVRLLNESIGRMKTKEHQAGLQQAMGETIVVWINKIESEPNETAEERLRVLKMLQVALQYAPNNPRVLSLVADQVLKTLESDDKELAKVRAALVKGSSPGIANFIRGTAALLKDDADKATLHLKLAAEHLPHSSAILNNLAVAMAKKKDGDLEQALQISEKAIESVSEPNAYFYETRGQILTKLGKHLEAIPDLERALAEESLADAAHESLAVCFEALGDDELAQEHRAAITKE